MGPLLASSGPKDQSTKGEILLRTRFLAAGACAAVLFGAAACGGSQDASTASASPSAAGSAAQQHGSQGAAQAKPDLSGVPRVVARVDGHPITRAEFSQVYAAEFRQAAAQQQAGGSPLDQSRLKKQTLDTMVGTELLVQEAHRKGMSASKQAVDDTLRSAAQQNGMKSPDQLVAALEKQGLSAQQVRTQVTDQILVGKVVSAEAGSTTPSRHEVKALYDRLVAQQKQQAGGKKVKTPPFSQVEAQLAQQLKSQKQSAATQSLVQRLRSHAHVTVNL